MKDSWGSRPRSVSGGASGPWGGDIDSAGQQPINRKRGDLPVFRQIAPLGSDAVAAVRLWGFERAKNPTLLKVGLACGSDVDHAESLRNLGFGLCQGSPQKTEKIVR